MRRLVVLASALAAPVGLFSVYAITSKEAPYFELKIILMAASLIFAGWVAIYAALKKYQENAERNERLFNEVAGAKREWERTFDSIKDLIYIHDSEGRITRANAEFSRYLGRGFKEIIGRPHHEIFPHPGIREGCARALEGGHEYQEEMTDHAGRTFLVSYIPVFDEAGGHSFSVHVAREISAIKTAEELLRQEAEVSGALVKLSEVANSVLDGDHLIGEIIEIAPQYIKADALCIFLCAGSLFDFRCAGGYGLTDSEKRIITELMKDENLAGRGILYAGREAQFDHKPLGEILNIRELIAMPIVHKQEILGMLIAGNRGADCFGPKEIGLLKGLSNSLAASLKNAALYDQTKELFFGAIKSLTSAIDAKSPWTRGHAERVTEYAMIIGRTLGLDAETMRRLQLASLLHDVGKIGTFDAILDKPGSLSPDEFRRVQMHPEKGAEIVAGIKQLREIAEIIKYHHERPDGKGYPYGLGADEIPLLSKIISVADAYDSMTSVRPYRVTPGKEFAVSELLRLSGSQFAPEVVEAFLRDLKATEAA